MFYVEWTFYKNGDSWTKQSPITKKQSVAEDFFNRELNNSLNSSLQNLYSICLKRIRRSGDVVINIKKF